MAHKVFSSVSTMLAAVALLAAAGCAPASAQTFEPPPGGPVVQSRCTKVMLNSETPLLPVRLIAPYLQQRDDFRVSGLVLTDDAGAADVSVALTRSGNSNTQIIVANRDTGRYVSAINDWTDYPGMVALSIMNRLRDVCPGSIAAAQKYQPKPKECAPAPALRSLTTLSACSQTSWMDDRELYEALRTNAEVKLSSIRLLPACGSADAMLEITHNLNQTLEWNWRLVSAQKETISNGRVIAFTSRNAAERINNQVAHEIALARGEKLNIADHVPQRTHEDTSIQNVRAHVLRSDFSPQDSRISLSLDNEKLTGRDAKGNLVFTFSMEDLLDVELRKEWNHPLQLDEPIGLVGFLETAADPRDAMVATAVLAAYAGIGAVLAQVRTPVHILDIAWQDKGAVKTVSVQVPVHESGRLLRALRPAGFGAQEQTCSSPTMVATSQR